MSEHNALEGFPDTALQFIAPLVEAVEDEAALRAFLNRMGWTARTVDVDGVRAAVTGLVTAIESLRDEVSVDSLDHLVQTLTALGGTTAAIRDFASGLAAAAGDVNATAVVLVDLADDILENLILRYLGHHPGIYGALNLVGLIIDRPAAAVSTGGATPALVRAELVRPTLALDTIGAILQDPVARVRATLNVQPLTSEAVAQQVTADVFGPLLAVVTALGGTGVVGDGGITPDQPDADDIENRRRATLQLALPTVDAGTPITGTLTVGADIIHTGGTSRLGDAGPGVLLYTEGAVDVIAALPGATFTFTISSGAFSVYLPAAGEPVPHDGGGVTAEARYRRIPPAGAPALALGADTAKLVVTGLEARMRARFGRPDALELHLDAEAKVDRARFVLTPAETDGFLTAVLPAEGVDVDFDLSIAWALGRGVSLAGGAGLEAELPVHVSLPGVLSVDIVTVRVATTPALTASAAVTVTVFLGPVRATVHRVGLAGTVAFPEGGGNVGPAQVVPRFLSPAGVGLAIDVPAVRGGGIISHDNGRYAGILDLEIAEILSANAIALISTREPSGFSLLVIVTATFPPFQIGFGFTLSGLGGILGLNRTMNLQALRDGARSGVLDSILFPVDPAARIAKVLSDVESVFPTAQGRFTIGFMVRLGWGSPEVVTVDLGIVVELPAPLRIALLGRLSVVLPRPGAAVVELHLHVIGTLDLGRGELSIDASLHDSRIAVFDVYGDMSIRVGWGANPAFAISVGGFNPRFTPPPSFPDMRRLGIALATGDNPRVRLEAYLATTSNSFQTGAYLDAYAQLDAGIIGVFSAGAWLGFDALIIFSPFQFIVDIGGGVGIKHNGEPFIGAEILLTVYGPQPFRATGYVEIHFLGTWRISFDVSVGDEPDELPPAAQDPAAALVAALGDPKSWTARLPDGAPLVVLVANSADTDMAVHPRGTFEVRQRAVPLGVTIERFGGAPLASGPASLDVTFAVGGEDLEGEAVRDAWAPGDLFDLTDDERLSRPSFEFLESGRTGLAVPGEVHGTAVAGATAEFETSVIDRAEGPRPDEAKPRPVTAFAVPAALDALVVAGQLAAAATAVAGTYDAPPRTVDVTEPEYVVASTGDLSAVGGTHASWIEARQAAGGGRRVQVVGAHEVVG